MKTTMRQLLLLLLCSSPAAQAQPDAPAAPAWTAIAGSAQIEINRATAPQYGIVIDAIDAKPMPPRDDYDRDRAQVAGALRFSIEHGHYAVPASGSLGPIRIALRAGARSTTVTLRLEAGDRRGDFALVDTRGRRWLAAHDVHQSFDAAAGLLVMTHLDLRAGPELARWARRDALEGRLVGGLQLRLVGSRDDALAKGGSSCLPAIWPGVPGRTTDVVLDALSSLDVYCNEGFSGQAAGLCDGNGTNPNAKLKFLPSVRLSNGGTTDVPWYNKFSSTTTPSADYPYDAVDQHPYLVWNVYRIGADGRIDQIGRSGVKHAFFTNNDDCACAGGAILFFGPRPPGMPTSGQCSDTYDAVSNDILGALGPRREVIARSGIFGRCESIFDPDCDGTQNPSDPNPESNALRYRAPVHESELAAALHAGARFFIEAWYVVRDDAQLYNTMRNREFTATWLGFWDIDLAGEVPNGGVIDRWVPPGGSAADARNTEVVVANGRLKLAVRVTPLGEGRHRYDYAVMNFEYADPVTSFAEPNLRIDRNHGIGAVRIPVPQATTTQETEFSDGDAGAADWLAERSTTQLQFAGSATNTLDWGSLYRYSFVADAPPVEGSVTLVPFEAGAPALVVASLVPGASEVLFANGFESP